MDAAIHCARMNVPPSLDHTATSRILLMTEMAFFHGHRCMTSSNMNEIAKSEAHVVNLFEELLSQIEMAERTTFLAQRASSETTKRLNNFELALCRARSALSYVASGETFFEVNFPKVNEIWEQQKLLTLPEMRRMGRGFNFRTVTAAILTDLDMWSGDPKAFPYEKLVALKDIMRISDTAMDPHRSQWTPTTYSNYWLFNSVDQDTIDDVLDLQDALPLRDEYNVDMWTCNILPFLVSPDWNVLEREADHAKCVMGALGAERILMNILQSESVNYAAPQAVAVLNAMVRHRNCDDVEASRKRLAKYEPRIDRVLFKLMQRNRKEMFIEAIVSSVMCIFYEIEDMIKSQQCTRNFLDMAIGCIRLNQAKAACTLSAWRILHHYPELAEESFGNIDVPAIEFLCADLAGQNSLAINAPCMLAISSLPDRMLMGKHVQQRLLEMSRCSDEKVRRDAESAIIRATRRHVEAAVAEQRLLQEEYREAKDGAVNKEADRETERRRKKNRRKKQRARRKKAEERDQEQRELDERKANRQLKRLAACLLQRWARRRALPKIRGMAQGRMASQRKRKRKKNKKKKEEKKEKKEEQQSPSAAPSSSTKEEVASRRSPKEKDATPSSPTSIVEATVFPPTADQLPLTSYRRVEIQLQGCGPRVLSPFVCDAAAVR